MRSGGLILWKEQFLSTEHGASLLVSLPFYKASFSTQWPWMRTLLSLLLPKDAYFLSRLEVLSLNFEEKYHVGCGYLSPVNVETLYIQKGGIILHMFKQDTIYYCWNCYIRTGALLALTIQAKPPILSRPIKQEILKIRKMKFMQCGHIGKRKITHPGIP